MGKLVISAKKSDLIKIEHYGEILTIEYLRLAGNPQMVFKGDDSFIITRVNNENYTPPVPYTTSNNN